MKIGDSISEVFVVIGDLADALGVRSINGFAEPWVHRVDENWTIAVNATRSKQTAEPDGCMAAEIVPYQTAIWWNGWLAALVMPNGGVFAAHPDGANEDRFIADVKTAEAKARAEATR